MADPTIGGAIVQAFGDIVGQMWAVIPVGLGVFGLIFGLGKAKKAGKTAAA